ncbi:MAG: hypothetical protein JWP11_3683 [Frankiales bacterium]|nr:hypothetical protein [Frankiales bacterium]
MKPAVCTCTALTLLIVTAVTVPDAHRLDIALFVVLELVRELLDRNDE